MNFKSCPRDGTLVRNPLKLIFFLKVINIFLVIGIQAVEKLCWLFLFPAYSLLAAEYGVPATVPAYPISPSLQRLLPDMLNTNTDIFPSGLPFNFQNKSCPFTPLPLNSSNITGPFKANKPGFKWPVQPVTRCSSFPSQTHSKVTNLFNSFCGWEVKEEGKEGVRVPQNKASSSAWRSLQKPVIIFSWIRELER